MDKIQSPLWTILVLVGSSTFMACSTYVAALASICSWVSCGRVEFLPEGSPIKAVPLPMMSVTLWPRSWNWRIFCRGTAWPRCRSGLVGSTPSLMLSGRSCSSFFLRPSTGTMVSVPEVMMCSCSSTETFT